jgi:hypothetical protein
MAPETDPLPAELRHQLDVAANVIVELGERQLEVHFDADHDAGAIRVHILDHTGSAIEEISPRRVLEVLAGSRLEI